MHVSGRIHSNRGSKKDQLCLLFRRRSIALVNLHVEGIEGDQKEDMLGNERIDERIRCKTNGINQSGNGWNHHARSSNDGQRTDEESLRNSQFERIEENLH